METLENIQTEPTDTSLASQVIVERQKVRPTGRRKALNSLNGIVLIPKNVDLPLNKKKNTLSSLLSQLPITAEPRFKEDYHFEKVRQLRRCRKCQWPRRRSHLDQFHSGQQIQLLWIQENLMSEFQENVIEIQKRAFEHGLWKLFLKTLAWRNQLDDYFTCCLILDDIRLLDLDLLLEATSQDEVIDYVLRNLVRKLDLNSSSKLLNSEFETNNGTVHPVSEICFKCGNPQESVLELRDELMPITEVDHIMPDNSGDELSFCLINFLEHIMKKHNHFLGLTTRKLLNYTDLLNRSNIPETFYLRAMHSVGLYNSKI